MNTEWKNAILTEIRNDPGVTSKGLIEALRLGWLHNLWPGYTPQDIYRDLYTLQKQGEITRTDDKPKRCYIATSEPDEVWVVADFVPPRNQDKITAGKRYRFTHDIGNGGLITDNRGREINLYLPSCSYLDDEPWRIVSKPSVMDEPEVFVADGPEDTITIQYAQHEHQLKLISELTTWKSNAIAKHPDLVDDPLIIQAREILADHYPHQCVPIMHGQWDQKVVFQAVITAITTEIK